MVVDIHPTAIIDRNVVLGKNVKIGPYSVINGKINIGDNTKILNNVTIFGSTIIGKNCIFWPNSTIGCDPQDLKYDGEDSKLIIGDYCMFRESCNIHKGTKLGGNITSIGNHCLFMTFSHVAHDCTIGNNVIIGATSCLGGHIQVGNHANISAASCIIQGVRIGSYSMTGTQSIIRLDIAPFVIANGTEDPKVIKVNNIRLSRCNIPEDDKKIINTIYKIYFKKKLTNIEAIENIKSKFGINKFAKLFIEFAESSKLGLLR